MSATLYSCVVAGCQSTGAIANFYSFPTRCQQQRNAWIAFVAESRPKNSLLAWTPDPNALICSRHFIGNRPSASPTEPNYIPTIRVPAKRHRSFEEPSRGGVSSILESALTTNSMQSSPMSTTKLTTTIELASGHSSSDEYTEEDYEGSTTSSYLSPALPASSHPEGGETVPECSSSQAQRTPPAIGGNLTEDVLLQRADLDEEDDPLDLDELAIDDNFDLISFVNGEQPLAPSLKKAAAKVAQKPIAQFSEPLVVYSVPPTTTTTALVQEESTPTSTIKTPPPPATCPICGQTFADRKKLKHHKRTHSEIRHYKCIHCTKSYIAEKTLQKHLWVKHQVGSLPEVGKSSTRKRYKPVLANNKKKADFDCALCEATFVDVPGLELHQRVAHFAETFSYYCAKHNVDQFPVAVTAPEASPEKMNSNPEAPNWNDSTLVAAQPSSSPLAFSKRLLNPPPPTSVMALLAHETPTNWPPLADQSSFELVEYVNESTEAAGFYYQQQQQGHPSPVPNGTAISLNQSSTGELFYPPSPLVPVAKPTPHPPDALLQSPAMFPTQSPGAPTSAGLFPATLAFPVSQSTPVGPGKQPDLLSSDRDSCDFTPPQQSDDADTTTPSPNDDLTKAFTIIFNDNVYFH